jgi:hypothetical protein
VSARKPRGDDTGAYAILYAVLVVALIGMASMVVDIATLRADKRDSRSTADFAALAGIGDLGSGPYTPVKACMTALATASTALGVTFPTDDCGTQFGSDPATCSSTNVATSDAGDYTVHVKWPVADGDPALTKPDGLQAGGTRGGNATFDGTDQCARLAVDVTRRRTLGLSAAFAFGHGSSVAASVARLTPKPTSGQILAGLNILDLKACQALTVSGQGKIIVNRALDKSRGTIAVESDGSGCPSNATPPKFVIDLGPDAAAQICVSGPLQVPNANGDCDGLGKIEAHAMDGAFASKTYAGHPSTPSANLRPKPEQEGGIQGWIPVTSQYGCKTMPGCGATPSYIPTLYNNDNGTWPPTTVYAGQGTYAGVSYNATYDAAHTLTDGEVMGPATAVPGGLGTFACSQGNKAKDSFYVPPGNWLVDCKDTSQPGFQVSRTAVFGGGHIIFRGGLKINGGACFSVNTPPTSLPATADLLTCPTPIDTTTEFASTSPGPTQPAIVFVRGGKGFVQGSSATTILLPQTMVVQANSGTLNLGAGSGTLVWTAPGAGPAGGPASLDVLCTSDTATITTCHDSHFAKTVYWNEDVLTGTDELTVNGQGGLVIVGTFFAPRSDFLFAGQGSYVATSAQFWVNTLQLSGKGGLGMTPDPAVSFFRLDYGVTLIR